MRDAIGLREWILWLAVLSGAALASCAMRPVPSGNNSNSLATPKDAANGQPPCSVFAVKICQDNARDRPSLFIQTQLRGGAPTIRPTWWLLRRSYKSRPVRSSGSPAITARGQWRSSMHGRGRWWPATN